jgi:uncharacterized coiled-coil protein SlyX
MTQWFEDTVNKQYSKICELEKTVSEQQSKIRELEKTVNKMSAEKQNSQPVAATPNNPQTYTPVNHEVIRPSKSNSKEFYMSTPNKDGSFWDRNSRQELDPTASCYKFTETAPGTAEFVTVDSSTFFQLAFKNPDYIIDPVCDSRDALTSDRKRIITVTPGKAQKNGDKWNVTTKAKIRYE